MSAVISSFPSADRRANRRDAAALRQALLPFVDDPSASSFCRTWSEARLADLDRVTASSGRWVFVMISPSQFGAVVETIHARCDRPMICLRLWTLCFQHLRVDTGEVMQSRAELAALLDVTVRDVSRCMSFLVDTGAISRRVDGRSVRYFVNPRVGTHLSGKARDDAQAAAPILTVIDGSAHPSQRRCRAAVVAPVVL
jgi:hypothetical protein